MELMQSLTNIVTQILSTQASLYLMIGLNVVIFCIEIIPQIPSRIIPLICVVLGPVAYKALVPVSSVPFDVPNPIAILIIDGMVIGLASFLIHAGAVKLLRSKFGWPPDPSSPTTSQPETPKPTEP